MKKKLTAIFLCVALVAIAVVGASLAYFTDTDSAKNTFTVGNVKIQLLESQYHRVNAGMGNAVGQKEPLMGGYLWAADVNMQGTPENTPNYVTSGEVWNGQYFSDAQIEADAAAYKDGYFAEHSQNMVPGANVRKNPYVKNTGSNDAYIRIRTLIPVSLFDVIDNGPSYWTTTAMNEGQVTSKAVDTYNASGAAAVKQVERDGIKYYEYDFTFVKPVKPGELTFWNVWGNIAIDKNATAEELANVESFDVIFEADAIQAEGFADATAAFAAFDA